MNKKRFSIRAKLMVFILPIATVALVAMTAVAYFSAKEIIENKTMRTLEVQASDSANQLEAWKNRNVGILQTAFDTMENLKMSEEELLKYEKYYLGTYGDFPNGIYIVTDDGKVVDASGWVPESDPRQNAYYTGGKQCDGKLGFVDVYVDDFTGEYVVTAAQNSKTVNGKGGVYAVDISLSVLSEVVAGMEVEGGGDAFIVDTSSNTILASTNPDIVGKPVEEIEDSFYAQAVDFVEKKESDFASIPSYNGTYMVSYGEIEETNWVVVVRALEKNVFSEVRKLGAGLIAVGTVGVIGLGIFLIFMIQRITAPIQMLTNTIVSVTDGDFTADVAVVGNDEVTVMASSMKRFMEVMRGTLGSIIQISDRINSQAQGSNEISGELHVSASGQAQAMGQMRENLDELVDSIGVIAESATTLAMVVADTNDAGGQALSNIEDTMVAAEQGRTSMAKVTESMTEMRGSMDSLEQSITNVGEAAVKINDITSTIRDIADETNLLALNASIEAARAGEAGRGFAVVASQIKSLAETSGDAANEISDLIASVTGMISSTVEQSQQSVEDLRSNAEMVDEASHQFDQIYENITATNEIVHSMISKIHEANDVASNMAAITEEQSASAEEIGATALSVQELADAVSDNSASVESESTDLAETATTLKDNISKFTI